MGTLERIDMCPECGDDIVSTPDEDGLFWEGQDAHCINCGLKGHVTLDSENHVYFDYNY